MKCPKCGNELGSGSKVDMERMGWCCSRCNIKIYKELPMHDNFGVKH